MLSHLLAFAAGAVLVWLFLRESSARSAKAAAAPAPAGDSGKSDPMRAPDPDLDADIIEYIGENTVYHINDICLAIEHPKGSRFVRAHVHMLLEDGKIRYRNMVYTV